uniref:Uncharacterized protein n=1 Tax=Anguilla anguilla TaxID=7936 RepID=A0A0E9XWR0_ANGAN
MLLLHLNFTWWLFGHTNAMSSLSMSSNHPGNASELKSSVCHGTFHSLLLFCFCIFLTKFWAKWELGFKHLCSPSPFRVTMISRFLQDELGYNTSTFSISLGLMDSTPVSMH